VGQGGRGQAATHCPAAGRYHGDPANVGYPAGCGLLAKAGGQAGAGGEAGAGCGRGSRHAGDRSAGGAAARVGELTGKLRTRKKVAREERSAAIARVTSELARLAEMATSEAGAVLRNGRRALHKALTGRIRGRLRRALAELAVTISRATAIVAQARSRLAGRTPDDATRLVSLHDPHAQPIRKGRIDRPVEFGYKAQVIDNDDGVIVDYAVETGNPPDAPSWHQRSAGSACAPAGRRGRSPPAAGTASPRPTRAWPRLVSAPWPSRARPRFHPPAGRPNMPAGSAGSSSGALAVKAGSATSNAATAGTAPGWTAAKEPQSGAGTASSPTTWSRSQSSPANPYSPSRQPRSPSLSRGLFQGEAVKRADPKFRRPSREPFHRLDGVQHRTDNLLAAASRCLPS
jgi:hypothetical protein